MPKPASTVSAAEISRLANVTRATVSNWRRRHADFPKAIDGSESRPLFDLLEVQEWLTGHGVEASESPTSELRTMMRHAAPAAVAQLLESLRRSGDTWASSERGDFADDTIRAMDRAATADGIRAAIDALAERALEDGPATGVYITPAPIAELMAALANSTDRPRTVLDPACGSGSLLLAAAATGASDLSGQDALPVQAHRTRLLLESADLDPTVRIGDSLTADAFPDLRADAVLCNPPYGQRDWGSAELAFDTRWDFGGAPPRGESELAWVQHAIAHLRPGGTAVLLLPPAVATRASGRKIRAKLARTGALRAVIGLAPGIAQPWHVGLQIWVLRRPGPGAPVPDTMLFIDTTGLPTSSDGEDRVDLAAVTEAALRAWRAFDGADSDVTQPGVATVVRVVDVLDDEVDLTPARYVRSSLDGGAVSSDVDAAIRRLTAVATELTAATEALTGWSASAGKSWRFVTVAELSNHAQLEWIKTSPPTTGRSGADDARPVLTAPDVATGVPASGTLASASPEEEVTVREGDVLIPAVRSDRTGGRSARVAGPQDSGAIRGPHLHTLRVDRTRLDPWFLAGFLTGAENISVTRTSTVRFDPSRLRVPVLSLAEQQGYGEMFCRLFQLRTSARRATYAAEDAAELLTTGLTAGALAPSDDDSATGPGR
ncbi:N-6 DNA methylase [Nocardia jejuensis]|uniref:N-6 DNA methylase n=1 Tax=Nocardia jejuensis TaxID=328049 RepID=UPI000833BD59|nr:N-6 DNA methylase [Nocardia jejuensis]